MELSREEKWNIYREVLLESYMDDAKQAVVEYLERYYEDTEQYESLFDYEFLVQKFDDRYNPAEALYWDVWECIIERYIEENNIELD